MTNIDTTKPIRASNGNKVEFIRIINTSDGYPLLAVHTDDDGTEKLITHTLTGLYCAGNKDSRDLVNVGEITAKFVNIYKTEAAYAHPSLARALSSAKRWADEYVTTLQVTTEDGKFVSVEVIQLDPEELLLTL